MSEWPTRVPRLPRFRSLGFLTVISDENASPFLY